MIETREVHLYKMVDMCATKDEGESMVRNHREYEKDTNWQDERNGAH